MSTVDTYGCLATLSAAVEATNSLIRTGLQELAFKHSGGKYRLCWPLRGFANSYQELHITRYMNPVHIYHNAYLKIDEFESSTIINNHQQKGRVQRGWATWLVLGTSRCRFQCTKSSGEGMDHGYYVFMAAMGRMLSFYLSHLSGFAHGPS
jgi:hypothetical protein